MCKIVKKIVEWNFSNLEKSVSGLTKIYSREFFLIFSVSSSVYNKTIFIKKNYGVTGSVFKIDGIDSKMWVKFVAMQQNSATLIYDLKTKRGKV